jgi:hypothetical protein
MEERMDVEQVGKVLANGRKDGCGAGWEGISQWKEVWLWSRLGGY